MEQNSYPTNFSGILKRKSNFLGMWRGCICTFSDSELYVFFFFFLTFSVIYQGLNKAQVFKSIKITPEIEIKMKNSGEKNKFTLIEPGQEPIEFLCDTVEDTLNWVQLLRGETFKSSNLSMNDFDIISVIGRGYYGKVTLVKRKITGELYALKSIHKNHLIKSQKMHTVMVERNILLKCHFEFIVSLKFAFQTDAKFYFGLEYASGGELFHLLESVGPLPIEHAKLYLAEISLAIQYLHSKGIIYRDLKLENVLLGHDGHVKLADFGLSKELYSIDDKTSTFCGTTEYLAPEVVKRQPYTFMIDWWSLGILAYEILFGDTPFSADSPLAVMQNIINTNPIFPDDTDPIIIDFINKLLEKQPNKRSTLQDLINHPFWGGLNFDYVLNKKYKPFFKPEIEEINNAIHFDEEFTAENPYDSIGTPSNDLKQFFSNFSYEDVTINTEEYDLTPSSILTLDLIDFPQK